jgi:hypothetical protein
MAVDYVCAVNKEHPRQIFGAPQAQPPVCCGKPMALVASAAQPASAPAPQAVAAAVQPQTTAKPGAPARAPRKSRKGAAPKR